MYFCHYVFSGVRGFPVLTMASFKPTKVQVYPKLGEKVTQDTLYWKNYKVIIFYYLLFLMRTTILHPCFCLTVFWGGSLFYFSQTPIQIKEFGAITSVDFSPGAPHNFAVTAFTRVCWYFFIFVFLSFLRFWSSGISVFICYMPPFFSSGPHIWAILPGACKDIYKI